MKLGRILKSVGRHALTFGGGAMTAGMFGARLTPAGAVITAIGVGLAAADKQQQEKREQASLGQASDAELRAELIRRLER